MCESLATPGTIIHGTLRPQDLIPAFADALERLTAVDAQFYLAPSGMIPAWVVDEGDTCPWYDSEEACETLTVLIDALNDCAPEGHYFGAHPGDGSDFGFWPADENED